MNRLSFAARVLAPFVLVLTSLIACEPEPCGDVGCACEADADCSDGNMCQSGLCIGDLPGPGANGQPCLSGDRCAAGGLCNAGVCEACSGESGCACDGDNLCAGGNDCVAGFCVGSDLAYPPSDPRCYSPCNSSFYDVDGNWVACDADGLFEGCRGETTCQTGNCIIDDGSSPTAAVGDCESDNECASWQLCLQGRCYSDCETDADCDRWPGPSRECHQHSCRVPCTVGEGTCGASTFCDAPNGDSGYCLPASQAGGTQVQPPNVFTLSDLRLNFNPGLTSATFTITNDGQQDATYVIRRAVGPVGNGTVLDWLTINDSTEPEVEVEIDAGATGTVTIASAQTAMHDSWNGYLEIGTATGQQQELHLVFFGTPDGKWVGKMTYFADFPDRNLDNWAVDPDSVLPTDLDNALIIRWEAFVDGQTSLDEFKAMLLSTSTGTWKNPKMAEYCPDDKTACYPYDNDNGYSVYTTSLDAFDVPSGATEMPMVMHLKQDDNDATLLSGRIDSARALHFPANPAVDLAFERDPLTCDVTPRGTLMCRFDSLSADVLVGGRFLTEQGGDCELNAASGMSGYQLTQTPWLLPGLQNNTAFDLATGKVYRYECRDPTLPLAVSGTPTPAEQGLNLSLSQANPIPDGRTRERTISLVDGVMVDGSEIILLFKETFLSYLGTGMGDTFSAYGIMRLTKSNAELDASDYVGNEVSETRDLTSGLALPTCDADLLADLEALTGNGPYDPADATDARVIASLLVQGMATSPDDAVDGIDSDGSEGVAEHAHWLCHDTGLIDGGEFGDVPCPGTSKVTFFTLQGIPAADVPDVACNQDASVSVTPKEDLQYLKCKLASPNCDCRANPTQCEPCNDTTVAGCFPQIGDTLTDIYSVNVTSPGRCDSIIESGNWPDQNVTMRLDPVWACAQDNAGNRPATCTLAIDGSGLPIVDRRANKVFYKDGVTSAVALGLRDQVIEAYRYKTQFRSRTGGTIGFAPAICEPGVSYCYEPETIEDIGKGIDCLVDLYDRHYATNFGEPVAPNSTKNLVQMVLQQSFAQEEITLTQPAPPATPELLPFPIVNEGYERLLVELMVMLGDEALTASFASRFDLAGSNQLGFEGSLFEPGGLDLAGGAGFEMYKLYQAVQYYQRALDRFYQLSPYVWKSVQTYGSTTSDGYIDQNTVTAWLERLIRASTQKALAQAEIASRYEDFNEPNLARHIIERAYTSTYIESVVMSRTMLELIDSAAIGGAAKPQIKRTVETAALSYRSALLRMQEAYEKVSDERTFFGFAPEYVPFPALNPDNVSEDNAFEVILASTRQKLGVAAEKEALALAQNRAYNVDAAAFQNELLAIENNYENQLGDICGTFTALDGSIYPAVTRYAHLLPVEGQAGDPCGGVGNGAISEAFIELQDAALSMLSAKQALVDHEVRKQIIEDRVRQECQLVNDIADVQFSADTQVNAWEEDIRDKQQGIDALDQFYQQSVDAASIAFGGSELTLGLTAAASVAVAAIGVSNFIAGTVLRNQIDGLETKIADREASTAKWVTQQDCTFAIIDANADTQELLLEGYHLDIEAKQAMLATQGVAARINGLFQAAQSVQAEMEESQQLSINLEAARNDPNVRIYKNDAIRTADRTFERAVREAYRLTKVYEYYTSSSYAYLGDLFLVRLVAAGDISLEAYVDDLEDAFAEFEEDFGRPDERVLVLSAKDDLLGVPLLDAQNQALTREQRDQIFRDLIFDPTRIDENGHLRVTFPVTLTQLSPLTRNHKVDRVEIELLGDDGDDVARAYLRQEGTGVVRGVDGEKIFFTFPSRTAVVNTFFNGHKVFDSGVYANRRLRDRPLANTAWSLLLNLRDENDNLDIDEASLSDVRIYFYYTDFTAL